MSTRCWARCKKCELDFVIEGVVVPCPVGVYVAGLEAAHCPQCGTRKDLLAYSPGLTPTEAKASDPNGFSVKLG